MLRFATMSENLNGVEGLLEADLAGPTMGVAGLEGRCVE